MTANTNFVLREVLDECMLIPLGEESNRTHGVIRLSGTGAFLWKALTSEQNVESLASALVEAYEVDAQTARHDVQAFIDTMIKYGCVYQ